MNRSILTALVVSTLSALAHGQNPPDTKKPVQEKPAPGAKVPTQAQEDVRLWMNDDVIGLGIVSPAGQRVGKVEDLVIQPDGQAAYAVVSFDEGMGFGSKQFIVPWTTLRSSSPGTGKQAPSLVLPLEKEQLATAPSFDRSKWPDLTVEGWSRDIDEFHGSAGMDREAAPAAAQTFRPPVRLSELAGMSIETSAGEKIGDVKRIAFDPSGRVGYTVVSVSAPGAPTRLLAIPLDAMQIAHDPADPKAKPRLLFAMDKSRLENAPVFDEAKQNDRVWLGTVYQFYSRPPYWQMQGSSTPQHPSSRPEGSKP